MLPWQICFSPHTPYLLSGMWYVLMKCGLFSQSLAMHTGQHRLGSEKMCQDKGQQG